MAAERDRRRSKNLGHSRWPGHRIALEPYQGRKGRTRPTAAHVTMTVMHRVRHAFGSPTHPATQALPFHGVLRKATVPSAGPGPSLDTSGRRGRARPEAGIKFCGRSFVPIIKFNHRVGYRTDNFFLSAVV